MGINSVQKNLTSVLHIQHIQNQIIPFICFRETTYTTMECKANQLAQIASWLHCANFQRQKSTLHPSAVGRKLPLSARRYQLALMGKTPHVGIIGAGVSGLRCADILTQNGAKVTILEARNRIGGRVRPSSSSPWHIIARRKLELMRKWLTLQSRLRRLKSVDT